MDYNLIGNFFEDEEDEIMENELRQESKDAEPVGTEGFAGEFKSEPVGYLSEPVGHLSEPIGHLSEPMTRERGQQLIDESMMNKDEESLLYGGGGSIADYTYSDDDSSDESTDEEDWSYLTDDISLEDGPYDEQNDTDGQSDDYGYLEESDSDYSEDYSEDYSGDSDNYFSGLYGSDTAENEQDTEFNGVDNSSEVEDNNENSDDYLSEIYGQDEDDYQHEDDYQQEDDDWSYLDEEVDDDADGYTVSAESGNDFSSLYDAPEPDEPINEFDALYNTPEPEPDEPINEFDALYNTPEPEPDEPINEFDALYNTPEPEPDEPINEFDALYNTPEPEPEPVKASENILEAKKNESLSSDENSQGSKGINFNFKNEVSDLTAENEELKNENEELRKQLEALKNAGLRSENEELKKQLEALRNGVVEHGNVKEARESNREVSVANSDNLSGNGSRTSGSNVSVVSDGAVQHKTEGSRVVTKPKLRLSKDDFAKMPPNQLFRYVESYAVRNGIASRTLTKEELVSKFGEVAINNLLRSRQGYLIRTKNNTFTLGNV